MCWKFVFAECHSLSFFSEINWTWVFEIWYFKAGIFKMGSFIRGRASFPAQLWSCQLVINFKKIISSLLIQCWPTCPSPSPPRVFTKFYLPKYLAIGIRAIKTVTLLPASVILPATHIHELRDHTQRRRVQRDSAEKKKESHFFQQSPTNPLPRPKGLKLPLDNHIRFKKVIVTVIWTTKFTRLSQVFRKFFSQVHKNKLFSVIFHIHFFLYGDNL